MRVRPPTADRNEINKSHPAPAQKNNENNLLIPCVIIQTFRPEKRGPHDSARFISPSEFHILEWPFCLRTILPYQYIEMSGAGLLSGQTAISSVTNMQQRRKTRPLNRVKRDKGARRGEKIASATLKCDRNKRVLLWKRGEPGSRVFMELPSQDKGVVHPLGFPP